MSTTKKSANSGEALRMILFGEASAADSSRRAEQIDMGEVLHFPNGHSRDIKSAHSCDRVPIRIDVPQPSDVTPVEILQDLLRQAEADQLVFLALHAFRVDGTCVHIEIGLVDPQSEDPPEAS